MRPGRVVTVTYLLRGPLWAALHAHSSARLFLAAHICPAPLAPLHARLCGVLLELPLHCHHPPSVGVCPPRHAYHQRPADSYSPTKEVSIRNTALQNASEAEHDIQAELWDCGALALGARKDHYFSAATCVLLCYDLTDHNSFANATSTHFEEAQERVPGAFIILVGCKFDRVTERVVNLTEAQSFATSNGAFFMEVSACDGTNVLLTKSIMRARSLQVLQVRKALGHALP